MNGLTIMIDQFGLVLTNGKTGSKIVNKLINLADHD